MTVKRFNLLDIIKGLMIIFIIITHFRFAYPDDYMKYGFFYWIDMAVPVFMIITGYLMALNIEKKQSFMESYSPRIIITKALRFLIPWFPVVLIEIPYISLINERDVFAVIKQTIIRGGYGPGAYYTPIMIQMIFLGPILYYVVKKFSLLGFILCFVVAGTWEAISWCVNLNQHDYALIALRYISLFAFGCYIAVGKKELNRFVLAMMFFIGLVWQTALCYIPLHPPFMNYAWARVNLYSSLFVLPIMYVLVKKQIESCVSIPILQELGKASYDIFLVQMAFYGCRPAQLVYKYVSNGILQFVICFTVCTTIGYLYYKIENPITKKIINAIQDSFSKKLKLRYD